MNIIEITTTIVMLIGTLIGIAYIFKGNVFSTRIRGAVDKVKGALDSPDERATYIIQDAKEELSSLRGKVANYMASIKNLESQKEASSHEVAKYQKIAEVARDVGNQSDALEAFNFLTKAKEKLDRLVAEITKDNVLLETAKNQIHQIEDKITNAQDSSERAALTRTSAGLREDMAKSVLNMKGSSAIGKLDSIEADAAEAENRAASFEELAKETGSSKAATLEEKYSHTSNGFDEFMKEKKG